MATAQEFVGRWGRRVRLTGERLGHLQQHPEMISLEEESGRTLAEPGTVVQSSSDDSIRLYYRWVPETLVGGKYLCGGHVPRRRGCVHRDRVLDGSCQEGGGGMDK